MNTPNNPFVPQRTLLELQSRRRSQFKLAVFCALAVGVTGLTAMLGCKREKPPEDNFSLTTGINTDVTIATDTNSFPSATNVVAYNPPAMDTNTYVQPPIETMTGADYKIIKGDTLEKIAKKYGVSPKALENANPKINPKKMKIGDRVVIPAAAPKAAAISAPGDAGSKNSYVVKPGDSLGKIAKSHGTTVNAIKAANNLTTDRINVKQVLKIPSKAEAAPVAPALAPPVEPAAPALTAPPLAPAPVK